ATLAATLPALAVPTNVPISKHAGLVKANSYIIMAKFNKLKDSVSKDSISKDSHIVVLVAALTAGWKIEHKYGAVFHGQGDESVGYVERSEAPVAERLDKHARGVVVDGIYTAHSTSGGGARLGATGTASVAELASTAATAVATTSGVATPANIFAVQVEGQYASSHQPSVATVSLGSGANTTVDLAVSTAISGGLHLSIAAGNNNVDTASTSPARVAAANNAGTIDWSNRKASFSDFRAAGYIAVRIGNGNDIPAAISSVLKAGAPSGTTNWLAQAF
ncbi:subtilisin-like serine protease, partial [Ceratobasidium sp. 370]